MAIKIIHPTPRASPTLRERSLPFHKIPTRAIIEYDKTTYSQLLILKFLVNYLIYPANCPFCPTDTINEVPAYL